jgi:tetratricopeptide (TPR) repeat protein
VELLAGTPESPAVRALESTLLAVRGAAAARREQWEDARARFDSSLQSARLSGRNDALAAALLNLIDLNTRLSRLSGDDGLLEEAPAAAAGTPYRDVLVKLLVERGVARTQAGDLAGAVAALDPAVELRPDWPFPIYHRGWARFLSGDSGAALDDYRACAQRKRVFFTVQREIRCLEDVAAGRLALDAYRSFCLLREHVQGKPAEVEEAAGRLLEAHPEFAPAHLLRAEARLALRDPDGAREAAREALRHDPDADTAAAALFFEWNVARVHGEEEAARAAGERLAGAYAEHPAAMIVERLRTAGGRNLTLRWTFAMDGTLHLEELERRGVTPPDRTPPSPGSPG